MASNCSGVGTAVALVELQKKKTKGGESLMKIEIPLLSAFLWIATTLLARAQAQGIEQALIATAIEYSAIGTRAAVRFSRFTR
jgi:hypothetical protein